MIRIQEAKPNVAKTFKPCLDIYDSPQRNSHSRSQANINGIGKYTPYTNWVLGKVNIPARIKQCTADTDKQNQ